MPDSGIVGFKSKQLVLEYKSTGEKRSLVIECEPDGTLLVVDADSDLPSFMERIPLEGFPTDALVLAKIEAFLGEEFRVLSIQDRGVELDMSALAGLKKMPVDIFDNVYLGETKGSALVLCVDIRNFSNFLCGNYEDDVFHLIKEFTSNLLSCVNQFGFGCSYYKLMGDGAIVIWDETDERSVGGALQVFDTYTSFLDEELFKPYPSLALAGALVSEKVYKYEISAEASQLKYRDYVGYGINLACRIQSIALRNQLIVNKALARTGLLPCREWTSPEVLAELQALKGLREEDRDSVLMYDRGGL